MTEHDTSEESRTPDEMQILRAVLGELTGTSRRAHDERMASDLPYRVAYERLTEMRDALTALGAIPPASLAPGFDQRVQARLQRVRADDASARAMARQFRRIAPAALAAAMLLIALTLGTRAQGGDRVDSVALATWYPNSADPTALP